MSKRPIRSRLDPILDSYYNSKISTLQLEEKEKSLMAAEAEVNALNRRVQGLEEDLEKTEEKLLVANQKLDKAATAADDSERMKKVSKIF